MKKYKTILKFAWIGIAATILGIYFCFPHIFTAKYLQSNVDDNQSIILFIYILAICVRSLFFIPSTVLLIMGIALYPDDLFFLLWINLFGILLGATLLYLASEFFTPESFFSEKKASSLPKIKEKINQYGFSIVLLWSFFPLVPTDLICYVAGATRMNFYKFMVAVFLGELILVSLYLFAGKGLLDLFIS